MESTKGCAPFALIAVPLAVVLALITTGFLADHMPDDDATLGASIGFFFAVYFSAFIIYRLMAPEFRPGQRTEALKWIFGLFGLGLLVAVALGSLLWLTRWLPKGDGWIWWFCAAIALLWLPDAVRAWKRWRASRAES